MLRSSCPMQPELIASRIKPAYIVRESRTGLRYIITRSSTHSTMQMIFVRTWKCCLLRNVTSRLWISVHELRCQGASSALAFPVCEDVSSKCESSTTKSEGKGNTVKLRLSIQLINKAFALLSALYFLHPTLHDIPRTNSKDGSCTRGRSTQSCHHMYVPALLLPFTSLT